jgi:hypothetical protein
MDVVPPGDADIKNNEENIFRPDDKPLNLFQKLLKIGILHLFQELWPMGEFTEEEQ